MVSAVRMASSLVGGLQLWVRLVGNRVLLVVSPSPSLFGGFVLELWNSHISLLRDFPA